MGHHDVMTLLQILKRFDGSFGHICAMCHFFIVLTFSADVRSKVVKCLNLFNDFQH